MVPLPYVSSFLFSFFPFFPRFNFIPRWKEKNYVCHLELCIFSLLFFFPFLFAESAKNINEEWTISSSSMRSSLEFNVFKRAENQIRLTVDCTGTVVTQLVAWNYWFPILSRRKNWNERWTLSVSLFLPSGSWEDPRFRRCEQFSSLTRCFLKSR